METTVFLSQIFGPLLLVTSLGLVLNLEEVKGMFDEISRSYMMRFILGVLELATGLAIVISHPYWSDLAAFIISLFGWGMILEGSLWLLAPGILGGMARKMRKNNGLMMFGSIVAFILGLFFVYFGYFA